MQIDSLSARKNLLMDMGNKNKELKAGEGKAFEGLIEASEKQKVNSEEKMTEMIDNIEQVKTMLEQDLTIQNLEKYKDAIRSFLNYYTKNELKMESFDVMDRKGVRKKMEVIRTVNEKVNNLTNHMLETHQGHLKTLKQIGEIQGLIIDMFV